MAQAAEAPDEGLLEFLGSVDTEDKDWNDYLARTDIDRVAHGATAPARPGAVDPAPEHPAPATPPAATPPVSGKPVTPP